MSTDPAYFTSSAQRYLAKAHNYHANGKNNIAAQWFYLYRKATAQAAQARKTARIRRFLTTQAPRTQSHVAEISTINPLNPSNTTLPPQVPNSSVNSVSTKKCGPLGCTIMGGKRRRTNRKRTNRKRTNCRR